jgi:hypothetical protein
MIRALKIEELIEKVTPSRERPPRIAPTTDRIVYLCERVLRLFQKAGYRYSCMRRSIVLYHFLRASGIPARIHFGAKWDGPRIAGHSWLTLDDTLLLDSPDNVRQFSLFFSEPRGRGEATEEVVPGARKSASEGRISFD